MATELSLIAVDLGASSGRVILVSIGDHYIKLNEVHRFINQAIHIPDESDAGRWCWDIIALWNNIKSGIRTAGKQVDHIDGIGIDSWGVDYGLIDHGGRLVAPLVAYRDPRTNSTYEQVINKLGRETIYGHTGIQFMALNTLYQLAADAEDPQRPLDRASTLLMTPQLISYWLTGRRVAEHTLASTTQLYDARSRQWVSELVDAIGVQKDLLPPVIDAGTIIGTLRPSIAEELSLPTDTPVIAVGSHDTASSVAATPLKNKRSAYLSSGTWSLLGLELHQPCHSPEALAANFTNEAGVAGTTRFLKNSAGLWILQECRRVWSEEGKHFSYSELTDLAIKSKPFATLIDPDDPIYAQPGDMPKRIRTACSNTGQPSPETPGAIARCILDSLALCYAETLDKASDITGQSIDTLHIVGGGCRNTLLNQITANTTGRRTVAGPEEATAIGNALLQAIALGGIKDLEEARRLVSDSISPTEYIPDISVSETISNARRTMTGLRRRT